MTFINAKELLYLLSHMASETEGRRRHFTLEESGTGSSWSCANSYETREVASGETTEMVKPTVDTWCHFSPQTMKQHHANDNVHLEGTVKLAAGDGKRAVAYKPSRSPVYKYERESSEWSPALRKERDRKEGLFFEK